MFADDWVCLNTQLPLPKILRILDAVIMFVVVIAFV